MMIYRYPIIFGLNKIQLVKYFDFQMPIAILCNPLLCLAGRKEQLANSFYDFTMFIISQYSCKVFDILMDNQIIKYYTR